MTFYKLRSSNRRGAMLVLIAVCLPLCVIMAAFAIDVAWMQLIRTELRTATDSAARAAGKELSVSQDEDAARARAKETARRNLVAGEPLLLADSDVEIGVGTRVGGSKFQFTPGGTRPNAIRVTARRTRGSAAGPVRLLFAGVLGVRQFEPIETSTSMHLDRDICLVVDRSGSMMQSLTGDDMPTGNCDPPHPTKSRWGALAIAVDAFLTELDKTPHDERVALVSYSSNTTECGNTYKISTIDSYLVSDYSRIRAEMNRISSKPVKGRTAISAGLDDGIKVLTGPSTRPFALKTVILMTDGIHNLGPEPIESARAAAKKDIVVHTITFSKDAETWRMRKVAAATGGHHFHAPSAEELVRIYKEIAAGIPVLLTE